MYFKEEESTDHLLVRYWSVSLVWHLYLLFIGFGYVQPPNVKDRLVALRRRMKKSRVHRVWKMVPFAIWWATSNERN